MEQRLKIDIQNLSEKKLLISFQGQFVLSELEKKYNFILNTIKNSNDVYLSLSNIKEIDLASYQFLVQLNKQFVDGKVIKFNLNVNENLKNILLKSGIDINNIIKE